MFKKLLGLACLVLCLILLSNIKLAADSQPDNYDWNKLTDYCTGRDIYGVSYNGNIFIAVGQKGLIMRSEDGFSWSRDQVGYEEDFCKIEWDSSKYIATTRSGRRFIENTEHEWVLSSEKGEPISQLPISVAGINSTSSCKLYGFTEGNKMAVAVGESGNIYYGTEKGQKPLENKLTFSEYSSYYREYIKRLGNSTVMHISSSSLYTDNNLTDKAIPAPFKQTVSKQTVVYIPAECVLKGIGKKMTYDEKTSSIEITINKNNMKLELGSKKVNLNGKQVNTPYAAIMKNNKVYIPTNMLELMGEKVFLYNNMIVISSVDNILDANYDEEILEALTQVFSSPKYQQQSLSESVVNVLANLGLQKYEEDDTEAGENYLLKAVEIEPSSELYAKLIGLNHLSETYNIDDYRQTELYSKARNYFESGLTYNCENTDLYTQMIYIYCDISWYKKAEECLNKAILFAPAGTVFNKEINYLKKCKGAEEPIKEITVSNYKELVKAIGSNRKIKVLPGNYDLKNSDTESGVYSVNNLTIIGVPGNSNKYIDLKDASKLFDFTNCTNVQISNLELKNSLDLNNCSAVSVNNCKIYHGLHIKNVYDLVCTNSYIEGIDDEGNYEDSIVEIHSSEQVSFDGCTMKGYTLKIGDSYYEPISNINISNSNLINNAGICSTWSNYVPIKENCGYEIELGTEGWDEWRFLAAIKYTKNNGFGINYKNTYDGNEEIFNDGKFLKLADKLDKLTNGNAFPSVDYIVGNDEDWNAYYDYYGKPKLKKLNINYNVKDLKNPNVDKLSQLITELKPLENDILSYGWPITVVLTDSENPYWIVAVAEFSNKSFDEFLDSGSNENLEKYCTIMLTNQTDVSAKDFFKIDVKFTEKEASKQIEDAFLTKSLSVKPNEDYGQINSIQFTIKNDKGVYYITPIESFMGQGDFMHYYTNMVVKTDVYTGEQYIAAHDITYKLVDSGLQETYRKYKDKIFEQLAKDKSLSKKLIGNPCKDVLLFVESDQNEKKLKFVFLTARDNGYQDSEFLFDYYIGTYDTKNNKVTEVDTIDLVDYEDMLYKLS